MIRLGQIRRSSRLIRSVFAVFVLAWLQMAAVPCVMAGAMLPAPGATETRVMEHEGMGHGSPDMPMSIEVDGHHDCGYCPPSIGTDQTTSATNCVYPDQPQAERGQLQAIHWMPVPSDLRFFDPVIQRHLPGTLVRAAPPQPRPLNLTYCVQLK